jgi:hypothetical protein
LVFLALRDELQRGEKQKSNTNQTGREKKKKNTITSHGGKEEKHEKKTLHGKPPRIFPGKTIISFLWGSSICDLQLDITTEYNNNKNNDEDDNDRNERAMMVAMAMLTRGQGPPYHACTELRQ